MVELRSFLPSGTPVLGLTATANKEMRARLVKFLGMPKDREVIIVSPNKSNIRFSILKVLPNLNCFDWLISLVQKEKENMPFTIIFCNVVSDIVAVLSYRLSKLGTNGMYMYADEAEEDIPAYQRCLIGVYYP